MASHESRQGNQNPAPGAGRPLHPPPLPPPTPQWGPPPQQQQRPPQAPRQAKREKDESSLTLLRATNFFVHAFNPRVRTGTLQKAGGEGTILERIRWTSAEKQRLLAAQTRLLPQIDTFNASQWREIAVPVWLEGVAVALAIALTVVVQAFAVFNSPAYTPDEGTFMANAWAILQGRIVPHIYTYDHPPLGWVQIAGWARITGGIASFGTAINSGRIFMLVLAALSSLFLYLITSRMSGSRSAAMLAVILYALSPLALMYRHEVLLYNIGTFWLLLSLCLVTTGKSRLGTFVLAAISLGIAILTDGIFLAFLPVMLYALVLYATPFQRKFSLVAFTYITLAIASAYVLLALLSGALFPAATHPSLIGSLIQKVQTPVVNGQFSNSGNFWLQTDLIFLAAGTIAMFLNILGGTVNRFQLLGALFAVTFWLMLLANRSVDPTFIVLLLPFLALNIALAINTPIRWVTRKIGFDLVRALLLFVAIGILVSAGVQSAIGLLQIPNNETASQQQSLLWLRDNAPHNAAVVTNSYLFTDLHDPQGLGVGGGEPFTQAEVFTDVATDPAFASDDPNNPKLNPACHKDGSGCLVGWQKIGFLVLDTSMLKQIREDRQFRLLDEALHHAILKVQFGSTADGTQIQIYQVIR